MSFVIDSIEASMEKAVFISKISNLKYVNEEFPRLYFGNEFCERLIPSQDDLAYILRFVTKKKMKLTFVTPFVTNKGLEQLKLSMRYLQQHNIPVEVVINDWGFLRWVNEKYPKLNIALGRLLSKQKRGPRIQNLINKAPESTIEHFRRSNVDNPILANFLMTRDIKRVELDNLLQNISRKNSLLKGSLYFPFVYITTTRFCQVSSIKHNPNKPQRAIVDCDKECQRYTFKLNHKHMPIELVLKGNTQFFKNEFLPNNLEKWNIDRLVYQPEIPI